MRKINIVIPMAGEGQRFKDAGYKEPKPLIPIKDEPMIERVVSNLARPLGDNNVKVILITRKSHKLYDLYNDQFVKVIELNQPTEGALCTALMAKDHINNAEPLLIANCDQLVEMNIESFRNNAEYASIVTFNSTNPHHSYVKIDNRGFVTEAKEKEVISDHAVAGLYYFRFGYDFVTYAEQTIAKDIRYNGEFYITPMFNEVIADGLVVNTYEIDVNKKHMLGTPEELQIFLDKVDQGVVDLLKL